MGGSVADYLAPAMGAAQWQNFHKNLITIVGNKYVQGFLDNTVGAVFSGTWTPGDGLTGFGGQFSNIWKKNYTDNVTDQSTGAQKFGYGALGVVNSILNRGLMPAGVFFLPLPSRCARQLPQGGAF